MNYRILGRSELTVSAVGLGSVTFGREIDEATAFTVMDRAREVGITLFDTAEAYGAGLSEEIMGRWLADRRARDEIVLATKVTAPLTPARIMTTAEASLRRLRTDCVDLYQLHRWDDAVPLEETLEALAALVRQGKARVSGCSNYAAWQLRKALSLQETRGWPRLESVQPNYSLVVRDIEAELLPLCADQQVGVISYSPLGGGFLTGKYRQGGEIPPRTRMEYVPAMQPIYFHETGFRILEGLRAKAAEMGTTIPLLALAWAMSHPGITSILIGARSAAQVDQAVAAAALPMPAALRAELNSL